MIILKILFTLTIILTFHFIYILYKNDLSIKNTIFFYKNLFIKKEKEKEKEVLLTQENIEESENNIIQTPEQEEIENGNKEVLPIDLTLSKDLSEEEIKIRKKVLEKIKHEPAFYKEGGRKKMIVPLESIIFLNKGLNPLVNENGEIIISIKENKILEELKEYIITLQNSGEILYQSDEEIIDSLKSLIQISKQSNIPLNEMAEIFRDKLDKKTKIKNEIREEKNEIKLEEPELSPEEIEAMKPKKKEIKLEEPELSPEEIEAMKPKKKEIKLEEPELSPEEIEAMKPKKKEIKLEEPELSPEEIEAMKPKKKEIKLEEPELSPEEIEAMKPKKKEDSIKEKVNKLKDSNNKEIVIKKEKTIKEFLQNKKWQHGENMSIDFKNLKRSLTTAFSNDFNLQSFALNIAKQQPIIFNKSKTVAFIDIKIIYVAYARLFGIDYDTYINKFQKLTPKMFNDFKEGIIESLDKYISDLITGNKKFATSYFDESGISFRGNGIWLELDFFKLCFNDEEFDFFKSFPYNDKIHLSEKKPNSTPLIQDVSATKI